MVESVADGETGFIIEKRDAKTLAEKILFLLKNPDKAAEMGRKGRERAVEMFSRERMTRDTIAVYEEAIVKHAAPVAG